MSFLISLGLLLGGLLVSIQVLAVEEPRRDALVFINGMMNNHDWYNRNYQTAMDAYMEYRANYGVKTDYVVVGVRNNYESTVGDILETALMSAAQLNMTFEDAMAGMLQFDSGYGLMIAVNRLPLLAEFARRKPWETASQDTDAMIGTIRNLLKENYRVVLLGHSQGTLFANLVFSKLTTTEQKSVEIVRLGNLTVANLTGVTHATDTWDFMVNMARLEANGNILPGNVTNELLSADSLRHNLKFYVNGDKSAPVVKGLLDVAFNHAKSPKTVAAEMASTPSSTPSVQCGTKLEQSGGIKGLSIDVDLGATPGRVDVDFDAYPVPDSLRIASKTANRPPLYETGGFVSGRFQKSFDHEPNLNGQMVKVYVVGSQDGTLWNLVVGCPGKGIENSDRVGNKEYTVTFNYGHFGEGGEGIPVCGFDFYIDGVKVGRWTGISSWSRQLMGGSEGGGTGGFSHSYSYGNVTCSSTLSSGGKPLTMTYSVNGGKDRAVLTPHGTSRGYISVP